MRNQIEFAPGRSERASVGAPDWSITEETDATPCPVATREPQATTPFPSPVPVPETIDPLVSWLKEERSAARRENTVWLGLAAAALWELALVLAQLGG